MTDEKQLAIAENATVPELIHQALSQGGGDLSVVKQLLDLQIAYEANEAKKAFAQAKARLTFPPIQKTRRGASSSYAPYEEVQAVIEPIYQAEGFDLSFDSSEKPDEKGGITIYGHLLHAQGYETVRHVWQPVGAVSKMMNPNQGIISATSYGKRALAGLIFNLKFVGVDDDGQSFSFVNERQVLTLENLIRECRMDEKSKSKFLEVVGAKTLSDILFKNYEAAFNLLLKKRAKVMEAAQKEAKK